MQKNSYLSVGNFLLFRTAYGLFLLDTDSEEIQASRYFHLSENSWKLFCGRVYYCFFLRRFDYE